MDSKIERLANFEILFIKNVSFLMLQLASIYFVFNINPKGGKSEKYRMGINISICIITIPI